MYLFSASTSMLQYLASEQQLQGVVFWLFGSLASATWQSLTIVMLVFLVCCPLLIKYAWDLNALATGDEVALSLGINAARGAAGGHDPGQPDHGHDHLLYRHHRVRLPGGPTYHAHGHRQRPSFPDSLCRHCGGVVAAGRGHAGRTLFAPAELPVGIVTAYIGVPMFLYLLITRRRQYFQ